MNYGGGLQWYLPPSVFSLLPLQHCLKATTPEAYVLDLVRADSKSFLAFNI